MNRHLRICATLSLGILSTAPAVHALETKFASKRQMGIAMTSAAGAGLFAGAAQSLVQARLFKNRSPLLAWASGIAFNAGLHRLMRKKLPAQTMFPFLNTLQCAGYALSQKSMPLAGLTLLTGVYDLYAYRNAVREEHTRLEVEAKRLQAETEQKTRAQQEAEAQEEAQAQRAAEEARLAQQKLDEKRRAAAAQEEQQQDSIPQEALRLLEQHKQEIAAFQKQKAVNEKPKWLPGYYIKSDLGRVENANTLRKIIKKFNLKHIAIPKKYIYQSLVIAEKIDAYPPTQSQQLRYSLPSNMNEHHAKDLCILIQHGFYNDCHAGNFLVSKKDNKLYIVDTDTRSGIDILKDIQLRLAKKINSLINGPISNFDGSNDSIAQLKNIAEKIRRFTQPDNVTNCLDMWDKQFAAYFQDSLQKLSTAIQYAQAFCNNSSPIDITQPSALQDQRTILAIALIAASEDEDCEGRVRTNLSIESLLKAAYQWQIAWQLVWKIESNSWQYASLDQINQFLDQYIEQFRKQFPITVEV